MTSWKNSRYRLFAYKTFANRTFTSTTPSLSPISRNIHRTFINLCAAWVYGPFYFSLNLAEKKTYSLSKICGYNGLIERSAFLQHPIKEDMAIKYKPDSETCPLYSYRIPSHPHPPLTIIRHPRPLLSPSFLPKSLLN
jgi:hypothetical protein